MCKIKNGMVPYLKDASKWMHKQRSNWGKGKSEWYSRPKRRTKGAKRWAAK